MILYHATTPKKAKLYRHSGRIIAPVRGFTTPAGAMAWAMKTGRTVIMEIECPNAHKLPDHHNPFGEAWWNDGDVVSWKCIYSASGSLEDPGFPLERVPGPTLVLGPPQTVILSKIIEV